MRRPGEILGDPDVLNACIAKIYQASLDPQYWDDALDEMRVIFGDRPSQIIVGDASKTSFFLLASRDLDGQARDEFEKHFAYVNPYTDSLIDCAENSILTDNCIVDRAKAANSEFVNDFLAKNDVPMTAVAAKLKTSDSRYVFFGAHIPQKMMLGSEAEYLKIAGLLAPHLAQALEISRRVRVGQAPPTTRTDSTSVLTLDTSRLFIEGDEATSDMLSTGAFAAVDYAGKFYFRDPQDQRELNRFLDVLKTNAPSLSSGAKGFLSNSKEYYIDLIPLVETLGPRARPHIFRIQVTISPTSSSVHIDDGKLKSLFQMTPAEIALTQGLLKGLTLQEYSDRANISRNNARNTLSRVFSKTGANSQPSLILRLAALMQR